MLLLSTALAAIATVTLAGCASTPSSASPSSASASGTISVVASTNVWGDIAATIGGDRVTVSSIIDDPDKDPHEYEADAQNQLALSKAQVVIENGGGYDDFVDTMLGTAGNTSGIVLNAVTISGKQPDANGDLNEHVWYDFPTVENVIDQIQQTYTKIDPAGTATYTKNATALKTQIDALEQQEAALKTTHAGVGVSITEPVPLYMLDAIGLDNKTPHEFSKAIENGTDVAPDVLQQTVALYNDHAVKLLAYNEQTTGAQTQAVLTAANNNNIPVVPVTETLPAGKTYISWMTDNLNAITTALAK
ncbi:metal ABC transporter solute-binding protein, Zn/Mn family [Subtercola lobariae]|nr:zinc ABC transporter substrate-binding protein [Subtercola lobariae]